MVASSRYGSKVQLNHLQCGDISYFITYKSNRKTVFKKVGKKSEGINEKKAIDLRNQILSELRHGVDLSQKSVKTLTFDRLAGVYFSSNAAHNKSNEKYQQQYDLHLKSNFGDLTISTLDDSLIYEFQALKLAEGLAKSTVNILVKLIKRIIGHGIERGIISFSPFKKIKMFRVENTRLRFLSQNEVSELNENIKDDLLLKLFVKIALSTGARATSILNIQKKHINFETRSVLLKDFKRGGMMYPGYPDSETFEMIVQHVEKFGANDQIVSIDGAATKYQKVYTKLTKIFEQFNQGIAANDRANKVVIHTLRHTFASHLAIKDTPIQKIQKLLNHKDIKQTMKYSKLSPDSGKNNVEDLYKG
ncbi:tyrosine-type recombinase/integrase [Poseidonibacter lekithochrous]|uniref:tyrosine-type recombinase/integrase n=1 Tax=Poseidonibacter lekithochrous TaxID=1904463 RepID=UPI000D344B91|nr:site-specific integrase [Poseidonibacter lekithochrous]